jgi:hypothetical protein
VLERATDDLSAAGVAAAAAGLAAHGSSSVATSTTSTPSATSMTSAAPASDRATRATRDATAVVRDPRAISRRAWLAEADALATRLADRANSRIVYRASWLICDDDETWIVRADVDHHQRVVRGQAGASLITWHGRRPVAGEALVAVRGVPTAAQLADDALASAASDALTLYTPGGAPTGPSTLVLAPALVARIVDRVLATPAVAARVRPSPLLTIVDDPTAPEAFAGHAFDDDGAIARASTIGGDGGSLAVAQGSARRAGPRWRLAHGPTHLVIAAPPTTGTSTNATSTNATATTAAPTTAPATPPTTATALENGIATGLVLDGVRDLRLDDDGLLVLRAARARELAGGQRTGRVWGDLELRADAGELLAAVTGVSQERASIALVDDGPPRGALAPWLVTRGTIAGGALVDDRGRR